MITATKTHVPEFKPQATVRRRVTIETAFGPASFVSFKDLADDGEHVALVFKGSNPVPLVRIHSECLTGDVFGSGRCDCGEQLKEAQKEMAREGGVILYLRQEGRGIGLYNKLDAYGIQDMGYDTFDANRMLGLPLDARNYTVAAQMLKALELTSIRLLTNNPDKARQLRELGVDVRALQETGVHLKGQNQGYLEAKAVKGGHSIDLKKLGFGK